MNAKPTGESTDDDSLPYDPKNRAETLAFWEGAIAHRGLDELRAKRASSVPDPARRVRVALSIDSEVLAWYRAMGADWQSQVNEALRAYRVAKGG